MPNVNKFDCVGRLGKDPEVRELKGGNKVAHTSIAVSRSWKDKATGEWQEVTSWWQLKGWNYAADKIAKRKKGDEVVIIGAEATVEKWTDKEGNERESATITLVQGATILKLWSKKQDQAAASVPDDGDDDPPF